MSRVDSFSTCQNNKNVDREKDLLGHCGELHWRVFDRLGLAANARARVSMVVSGVFGNDRICRA
jgi:hypothetical protein